MSERGRVEGGKVNSHQHIGEGWTTVERKRRSNRWEGKGRFLHRNPDVGKWWRRIKGTSLFVDDLPPFYDSNLLRSLFKGLGKIIGSFVPWKRRIVANTRYGFVHFEKEEDAAAAMKKLDGAFIFGHKLKIKKSLVIKDTKKEDRRGAFLEKGKNGGSAAFSKGVKSYAEVLASNNLVWARKQKENLTNKEGDAVKVSTRDVNGDMMMQVTVSQWNNIILNQKNLEEKLVNIERWCLDLQEDLRRSRERFEAKEEKEKVSDSVDDLSEEKKEEGLENKEYGTSVEKVSETGEEGENKSKGGSNVGCEPEFSIFRGYESEGGYGRNERWEEEVEMNKTSFDHTRNLKNTKKIKPIISLKLLHLGSKSRPSLPKKKSLSGPCSGIPLEEQHSHNRDDTNDYVHDNNTSETVSMNIEKGEEGKRREKNRDERFLDEAYKTIEVGKQVGVHFNTDPSSAIEKLVEMEKQAEARET